MYTFTFDNLAKANQTKQTLAELHKRFEFKANHGLYTIYAILTFEELALLKDRTGA